MAASSEAHGSTTALSSPARSRLHHESRWRGSCARRVAAQFHTAPAVAQSLPAGLDKQNALVIDTTKGRIVIKLRTDIAPKHAEMMKLLTREGFYNNVPFHRVMDGFMAQTGDGKNFDGTGQDRKSTRLNSSHLGI